MAEILRAAGGLIGVVRPMGSSAQMQVEISNHLDDGTGVCGRFGGTTGKGKGYNNKFQHFAEQDVSWAVAIIQNDCMLHGAPRRSWQVVILSPISSECWIKSHQCMANWSVRLASRDGGCRSGGSLKLMRS